MKIKSLKNCLKPGDILFAKRNVAIGMWSKKRAIEFLVHTALENWEEAFTTGKLDKRMHWA